MTITIDELNSLGRLPQEYRKLMVLLFRHLEQENYGGCYEVRMVRSGKVECYRVQRRQVGGQQSSAPGGLRPPDPLPVLS